MELEHLFLTTALYLPKKIDQGFNGYLKIGFYNGGRHTITFKKDAILAGAIFHETEETMPAVKEEQPYDRMPFYNLSKWDIFKQFLILHRISIISLIVAVTVLTPLV